MNSTEEKDTSSYQIQALKASYDSDIKQLTSLQLKLADMRRNVETRSKAEEIILLENEVASIKKNITETKETLSLLQEYLTKVVDEDSPFQHENTKYQVPLSLPQFDISNQQSTFDIADFIELFEVRLQSASIPDKRWPAILLANTPANDMATISWLKKMSCTVAGRMLSVNC